MATRLQRKLAREIIKDAKSPKPRNKKQLLVSSGYSEVTAGANAEAILEQKGVKEALKDFGFSEENAKRVVGQILNNDSHDPNARLKAADQVFKVHGSYAPDKHLNVNVDIEKPNPELEALADKLDAILKGTDQ